MTVSRGNVGTGPDRCTSATLRVLIANMAAANVDRKVRVAGGVDPFQAPGNGRATVHDGFQLNVALTAVFQAELNQRAADLDAAFAQMAVAV